MTQLHKRFSDDQIKDLFGRYLAGHLKRQYLQEIFTVGKSRFFQLLEAYRASPQSFTIQYHRKQPHKISPDTEANIINELKTDKNLIGDKETTVRRYNYSYIRKLLKSQYHQTVSLTTIIKRAKQHGFYMGKPPRATHDRIVSTDYVGQLLQHDSSHHKWSPYASDKWYLITTIDDYSRLLLYAQLVLRESSWTHIQALEAVWLKHGFPFCYYVDSHSVFRYVKGRDPIHYTPHKFTDEVDPQWKQILIECNVKLTYALSPQAKGKIERPYGWLQDHLVRTCARKNVTLITQARDILRQEVYHYNFRQVHSTTQEVPYFRFQRALKENKSLFRPFALKPPFPSIKDIFCLRTDRTTDAYRRISLNNLQIPINGADPYQTITLRIYPAKSVSEVRCWSKGKLLDVKFIKNDDLKGVQL